MAAKNQYFLKDKKAQIYLKMHRGTDDDGFPRGEKYYPISSAPVWCYTRQLSQQNVTYSYLRGVSETRMFVFNHYGNVEVYDLIRYNGNWYRITRTDTQDDYNSDLFVYVENAVGGYLPKDSEIQPYTPGIWENR